MLELSDPEDPVGDRLVGWGIFPPGFGPNERCGLFFGGGAGWFGALTNCFKWQRSLCGLLCFEEKGWFFVTLKCASFESPCFFCI